MISSAVSTKTREQILSGQITVNLYDECQREAYTVIAFRFCLLFSHELVLKTFLFKVCSNSFSCCCWYWNVWQHLSAVFGLFEQQHSAKAFSVKAQPSSWARQTAPERWELAATSRKRAQTQRRGWRRHIHRLKVFLLFLSCYSF